MYGYRTNPRARKGDTTATRYIGTCGVCEREIKLDTKISSPTAESSGFKLVHHGYKRPGHGSIEGDCFAVGYAPYEESLGATEEFLGLIRSQLDRAEVWRDKLESGEVKELRRKPRSYERPQDFKVLTPKDGYEFRSELEQRLSEVRYEIRMLNLEIKRLEGLVDRWQRRPVRTEEEILSGKRERVEASKAVRQAARDVKAAKRAAIDQKNAEREQERQEMLDEYRRIFNELAFDGSNQAKRDARNHWSDLWKKSHKKAYLRFSEPDLGIDEALVALGLASPRRPEQAYGIWTHWYADQYGVL